NETLGLLEVRALVGATRHLYCCDADLVRHTRRIASAAAWTDLRGNQRSPASSRGAQIRTGDLSDPNGARYQAAPHPEAAQRVATFGADRSHFSDYVAPIDNSGGQRA